MLALVLAIEIVILRLISVHGPDGQPIEVNVDEISTIRTPREFGAAEQHFGKTVRCALVMTNGKFVPTRETCSEILTLIGIDPVTPNEDEP